MTLWIARFGMRMLMVLLVMLLVEFASFVFAIEYELNRLYWVPVSFLLVAYGGYDTVRRMPLIWGVIVGAVLAGSTSMLSLMVGSLVLEGRFRMPADVDPLLLFTTLLMTSVLGAIVGGAAGVLARARRRERARRSAIQKLSPVATDEQSNTMADMPAGANDLTSLIEPPLPLSAESR
jgi:gas vesicle protein